MSVSKRSVALGSAYPSVYRVPVVIVLPLLSAVATLLPFLRPCLFYELNPLRIDALYPRLATRGETVAIGGVDHIGGMSVCFLAQGAALYDTLSDDRLAIFHSNHIA